MKAEVTTINETTHRLSLTGFTGELHENIRLDYDFALRRDADRFCKMINSSLSSKITALKEKFSDEWIKEQSENHFYQYSGFGLYATYKAALIMMRDQILKELEG